MPKKVLYFVIFLLIAVLFLVLNSNNTCDISFGFYKFEEVPVFYSLAISFVLGMLVILPFALFGGKKSKTAKPKQRGKKPEPETTAPGGVA
jgi:uncharacterized integral membrane protein